jgi:hypothetical protein
MIGTRARQWRRPSAFTSRLSGHAAAEAVPRALSIYVEAPIVRIPLLTVTRIGLLNAALFGAGVLQSVASRAGVDRPWQEYDFDESPHSLEEYALAVLVLVAIGGIIHYIEENWFPDFGWGLLALWLTVSVLGTAIYVAYLLLS